MKIYQPVLFVAVLCLGGGAALAETVTVRAQDAHEECFDMKAGDRLSYEFRAAAPLDFNVHYHVGDDVTYPVQQEAVTEQRHELAASIDQHYCLMWINKGWQETDLNYEYEVLAGTAPPTDAPETPEDR